MRRAALLVTLMLTGCGRAQSVPDAAPDLETAAIQRGLVRDPAAFDPVGLYARDTDRLCIVDRGDTYRVGAHVDYGDDIACNGAGTVRRSGSALRVDLGRGCRFDAQYDGDRIVFPAAVPDTCRALCSGRASFASLNANRLSASASEAMAMRDPRGRRPCATD